MTFYLFFVLFESAHQYGIFSFSLICQFDLHTIIFRCTPTPRSTLVFYLRKACSDTFLHNPAHLLKRQFCLFLERLVSVAACWCAGPADTPAPPFPFPGANLFPLRSLLSPHPPHCPTAPFPVPPRLGSRAELQIPPPNHWQHPLTSKPTGPPPL